MAKTKEDQLELEGKTGICPICKGVTVTRVLHYGGFSAEQLDRHAIPDSVLPERAANPVTPEETAALAAFQVAHAARARAADAVIRLEVELHRPEQLGGSTGFEPQSADPVKQRARELALEEAKGVADEALEKTILAEAGWKKLRDARHVRIEEWRRAQMAATHKRITAGKPGLAARLRTLLG